MRFKFLFIVGALFLNLSSLYAVPECTYVVVRDSVVLKWTGYKFTEKSPVDGSFELISFEQGQKKTTEADLFKSVSFSLETASINSGLPLRDKKLALFLFGAMKVPEVMTGKVLSFDEKTKKAEAEIRMNEQTVKTKFSFSKEGANNRYTFRGSIDLLDFKMNEGLEKLTRACGKLHTGVDGVAKTWSTVDLNIQADVKKICSGK